MKLLLAASPRVRYATGMTMYFAQGIPAGLLNIAMPAWLVSKGVSKGDIASYLAVIVLPWAFKLVTGPLMDRYEFLAMGRRRPWALGAQLGLVISSCSLVLIDNPTEDIGLLMALGVLINIFAATQDVAVDGMAIDLVPTEEQGRLNGFMTFGKAVGWSLSAAVSGYLLVTFGLGTAGLFSAIVTGAVLIAFVFVRERDGEKLLPWTSGEAQTVTRSDNSFGQVFAGINSVLWARTSVVVLLIMFFDGLVHGYGHALMPIAAVKIFGFTPLHWSQLVAIMGLFGAVIALGFGSLIDRLGAKRMLLFTLSLVALHAFMLAQTQHLWQDTTYVRVMLSLWVMLGPLTMVCVIALAMPICSPSVSATQFAIYMSTANLGSAAGSKAYGVFADDTSYVENYVILGVFVLVAFTVILFHRPGDGFAREASQLPGSE